MCVCVSGGDGGGMDCLVCFIHGTTNERGRWSDGLCVYVCVHNCFRTREGEVNGNKKVRSM